MRRCRASRRKNNIIDCLFFMKLEKLLIMFKMKPYEIKKFLKILEYVSEV